ncbi:MAG: type II CAAX endopeptidase family protein [Rhizomicrobium sp.]|jgi:membrane protease YdiL (CAAX protease family)
MRIVIFLISTIVLSLPWWWLGRHVGGFGYITFLMWSPALAAAFTVKVTGGNLGELGWRGSRWKWIFAGWAVTLVGLCIANGAVFVAAFVQFPTAAGLADTAKLTGLSGAPSTQLLFVYGVIIATAGMLRLAAPALGEELGWRGFLAPALCSRFGFAAGSLLSGFIWAAWHFPLMVGKVPLIALFDFTITITGMGVAYSWFRLKSNSVWPTTVMHGLHNALGAMFLKLAATGPAADTWLDETGYALPVMGVVLAIIFLTLGSESRSSLAASNEKTALT